MLKSRYFYFIIIVLWAAISLIALFVSASSRLVAFDPSQTLKMASLDTQFDIDVAEAFAHISGRTASTVFHISSEGCSCNNASVQHIASLNKKLSTHRYHSEQINLANHPELKQLVPSVPALVVFDEQGQLGYLGPYSSGWLCSGNSNIVDPIVDQILENRHLGAQVVSESEGCFCQN